MPSKKKKYNARFPAGRIKKIMQTDEEVGKVAQAVPVIISRTLELFVESLLTKSMQITQARSAKTLTPSHMKQCILSESRFDFLKDLVKNIPDASTQEDNENNAIFEASSDSIKVLQRMGEDGDDNSMDVTSPTDLSMSSSSAANFYTEQQSTSSRTPVIQYGATTVRPPADDELFRSAGVTSTSFCDDNNDGTQSTPIVVSTSKNSNKPAVNNNIIIDTTNNCDGIPPLIPIAHNLYNSTEDTLCIDEDYDN